MSEDWTPYIYRREIFWGDTDPARIAYTGRFADFALEAIESFYRARLGTDWSRMAFEEDLGTPFAHLELDFKSPVTTKEPLAMTVIVARAGRSSVDYHVIARGAETGELRFTAKATNVWVQSAAIKPVPIPERYREIIDREIANGAELL
jgi:4-hydroxybenzoyl-CoA thioesterase